MLKIILLSFGLISLGTVIGFRTCAIVSAGKRDDELKVTYDIGFFNGRDKGYSVGFSDGVEEGRLSALSRKHVDLEG